MTRALLLLPAAFIYAAILPAGEPKPATSSAGTFPLNDGCLWVMAGDSITEQHLHSRYIEAYCFARFPQWRFSFRNAGISGITCAKALPFYETDVAAWKPTLVSLEYGMNDSCVRMPELYIQDITAYVERIRADGAVAILISPSPINSDDAAWTIRTRVMRGYAEKLVALAAPGIVAVDQFTPMTSAWAANRPAEHLAHLLLLARKAVAQQPDMPGRKHLQAFLAAQEAEPEPPVSLSMAWKDAEGATSGNLCAAAEQVLTTTRPIVGKAHVQAFLQAWEGQPRTQAKPDLFDPVHPNPVGQLLMAASILASLHAPAQVSSAVLDGGSGRILASEHCRISKIVRGPGSLAFTRLDEALPFPIADEARAAVRLTPSIGDLSLHLLQVRNLKPGTYRMSIDGTKVASVTSTDLEGGWNMGLLERGPIADQGRAILTRIAAKDELVKTWRQASRRAQSSGTPADIDALATQTQRITDADVAIRDAAKPVARAFRLTWEGPAADSGR